MRTDPNRRLLLRAVAASSVGLPALLAGCAGGAGLTGAGGAVLAQAPAYRVGDRWHWRIDSQFRAAPDYDETMEIVAVGADGVTARVTTKGGGLDVQRTERWPAPGRVAQGALMDIETRRFAQPLERYRFPLADGQRWNQWVDQVNDTAKTAGPINRYVSVGGLQRVAVPAGTFDAVRMTVIMTLDDETPFRHPTECTYIVWYAPAVRNVVREERRAKYREKMTGPDSSPYLPAQNEVVDLVAHQVQ